MTSTVIDPPYAQESIDMGNMVNVRRRPFYTKPIYLISTGAVLVVVVIVAAVMAATGGGGNEQGSSSAQTMSMFGPKVPAPQVSESEYQLNKKELSSILISVYNKYNIEWNTLAEPNTPGHKALATVAGSSLYGMSSRAADVQRFALVTFYYATYDAANVFEDAPGPWNSADQWLTNAHECEWEGILCDNNFQVTGIYLPLHQVSGSLPLELMFLSELTTIDLRNNVIYMEESLHNVFLGMYKLQELLLDDNYVIATTGLPSQFAKLTSLQKLSISYNLLQGEFDSSVFEGMQQLSHLELESNYIQGGIPDSLAKLPNLLALYLRRNSLSFELADLITPGNIPKIFALWLDSNDIRGTIPSDIAGLTDLASFSVTNATLTGAIPDELGQLSSMKRCWLYNNKLEGQIPTTLASWTDLQVFEVYQNEFSGFMPDSICLHITDSSYEYKTLSADCDEVVCNCCTACP